MPMEDPWPDSPYYMLMSRKEQSPLCTVWPVYFKQPVKKSPVPLASDDSDVTLRLQPLIDTIYKRSRYHLDIDYTQPCRPPLSEADAQWLKQRLGQVGNT